MMKRRKMRLVMALMALGMLSGCSKSQEETPAQDKQAETEVQSSEKETEKETEETEKKKDEYVVLGEEEQGSTKLTFANQTSHKIQGFACASSGSSESWNSLMKEGQTIEKEAGFDWFAGIPSAQDTQSRYAVQAAWDVRVTLDDGSEYVLHGLMPETLAQADNLAIQLDQGVLFLTYTSADEQEVSTFETELSLQKPAIQDEEEVFVPAQEEVYSEPAGELVPEQPVYQEPVYEEPVYQQPVYQEPAYEIPEAPVYEDPGYVPPIDNAPTLESSGSEGCLGGL